MKNKKFQSSNFLKKKKNQSLILQITRYECLFKNRYEDRVPKQKKKERKICIRESNMWYRNKISRVKLHGLRWTAVHVYYAFEGETRVGEIVRNENRELTFKLGKRGRCRGIDQSECQVLQGGIKVSVDLQHQAEP